VHIIRCSDANTTINQLQRDCIQLGKKITDQDHTAGIVERDLSDGNTPKWAHSINMMVM
jgi:hypothetical protein